MKYCLSISKLQWYHKCILWMNWKFDHTHYWAYPCQEMGFKLIHYVRKRGPCKISSWLRVPCLREWVTGINGIWMYRVYNMPPFRYGVFQYKDKIPISQDPSIPVRRHLYTETDPRGPVHERFPKVIKIRWKLDFKCNFIVGIISLQHFIQLSCHVQNFITIISPKPGWEQHEISIEFKLRLKNRSWNVLQLHRFMLVPCFGMGLPQIIAVRKYFVDTMRNYAIRLLTSPDVMCKYNLITPLP